MIGANLKKLRLSKKLTLEKLAELLNIRYPETVNFNKGKLSKWENEKEEPKLSSIRIMADFYNISIDDLYSGNLNSIN
ncbi:TPA: helix-turn-helix domain-containing protein, partial [Enterococcus faecalis]